MVGTVGTNGDSPSSSHAGGPGFESLRAHHSFPFYPPFLDAELCRRKILPAAFQAASLRIGDRSNADVNGGSGRALRHYPNQSFSGPETTQAFIPPIPMESLPPKPVGAAQSESKTTFPWTSEMAGLYEAASSVVG